MAPATVTEAVLSQPLIALLRGFDPFGALDVLTTADMAPLFRSMPAVDDIIETAIAPDRIALSRRAALARQIEAKSYDCAYILQDVRTAAIAPWLARIPHRIGAAPGAAFGLINRPLHVAGGRARSVSERFSSLAFKPGQPLPAGLPAPQLDDPPALTDALARRLGLAEDRPLVLLCPASELGPTSEWPVRHHAALAAMIADTWPAATIGVLGRARDRAVATQVTVLSGRPLGNWAGRLNLHDTLALMRHANAVVSSESHYMHLAAALGRPHVAIYGAGDPRAERISGNRRSVLWLRLECSPCLDAHCGVGHMNCLNQQAPAAVFAALRRTMRFSATA